MEAVSHAGGQLISDINERALVIAQLASAAEATEATSVESLIRATEIAGGDIEQELEVGNVNIFTMHRAKGLTAKAVIVVAAEDEYLPGRAQGDAMDDERRLLYVSLTRAKHHLFITYCDRRTGRQRYTGRTSPATARSLTRFLRDGPLTPLAGQVFIRSLEQDQQI
jgi:superfamily I DNA/RNA helicase